MQDKSKKKKHPSMLEVTFSVIAAAFGVQSKKNSERDFTTGKPWVFIIAGLIFTFLFIMMIIGIVSLVLEP